ncbi:urease subunit beta [Edwardsiella ictaluri]|uniref:Urease subunit beta n=2 Tax=Edwardsiella ictaluri TaxID=67780 RepID=C5BDC1_EDWI9|nr:urease subunit beta [Edwardsiella ictaluri]ACR69238.1 urease, beta subunit, putative [Edwardsiella ictaluri 93-146]EKS7764767.1 urease subunit beta [Edwardsiella ictaluri]EKS7771656.1 urease subunit beta [Edwardsiella ictaluri]EKS7774836.1 urease subunit beta [Edwardsiella ictaluri]EKS7778101.1 urease subunit beta [Edwardsiella ictaluri]
MTNAKNSKAKVKESNVPVGGLLLKNEDISFNEDKPVVKVRVRNTGDRAVQVGSHFHFFEANRALEFDRSAAYGMRLNIMATTAIRFEPGDEIEVSLIPFGGKRLLYGFNNLLDGWAMSNYGKEAVVEKAIKSGFKFSK